MKTVTTFAEALRLAINHYRNGNYPQAEIILRKLSEVKPGHKLVTDNLIQAIFDQGRTAEALALYDQAVDGGAYACDADYDAVYRAALLATRNCPAPLKRRIKYYTLLGLLTRALALEGDTAECGCYRGLSSYLMLSRIGMHEPGFTGGGYHIFDSFQGLSAPTNQDEVGDDHPNADSLRYMCSPGRFSAPLEEVKQALSPFPGIDYHPGWIPFLFQGLMERDYRFVHLDVDLHEPTRACLEYFYPRMTRNGIIVCDDYGWPGARLALEEYCGREGAGYTVTEHAQAVIVCS